MKPDEMLQLDNGKFASMSMNPLLFQYEKSGGWYSIPPKTEIVAVFKISYKSWGQIIAGRIIKFFK